MRPILIFAALIFFAVQVHAATIGVSPGVLDFSDVLKDGYAEADLVVSTNSDEIVYGSFVVLGEISSWISFDQETNRVNMTQGKPHQLKVMINPPADAKNGVYTAKVKFVTESGGGIGDRAGSSINVGVESEISVEITGEEKVACSAGGFVLEDNEIGKPIDFYYTVHNKGNVRIKPLVKLEIWDQMQENIIATETVRSDELLPTTEAEMHKLVPINNLPVGQYWVYVSIDECQAGQLAGFSILEKGGISDKGSFSSLTSEPFAYLDEPLEVKAVFQNMGQRTVFASFKGDARVDDKITEVIETEEIEVASGETEELIFYYTPKKEGRHIIKGRIHFNNKITFERSMSVDVFGKTEEAEKQRGVFFWPLLIYLAIIIAIVFLARTIIKRKS